MYLTSDSPLVYDGPYEISDLNSTTGVTITTTSDTTVASNWEAMITPIDGPPFSVRYGYQEEPKEEWECVDFLGNIE